MREGKGIPDSGRGVDPEEPGTTFIRGDAGSGGRGVTFGRREIAADRGIQESRLVIRNTNGIRFMNRRNLDVFEDMAETGDREVEMRLPIAQVRPKGDRDNHPTTQ